MRYVVIGAGGAGGILGAELYRAGLDVTLIARGAHLDRIQKQGLILHDLQEDTEEAVPVPACREEDCRESADVIFVCVKGYSIPDTVPFLQKISTPETVIIPILNIFTTGETLRRELLSRYVVDGCIYVSANIEEPGKILQHSKILRIVYGAAPGQEARPVLEEIQKELSEKGIRAMNSPNIRRDALKKFSYVSPIGAAGLYFRACAGDFQKEGPERELYIGMMKEVEALASAMGCAFEDDVIARNLNILAHQPPEATTSLQRDVYEGKETEIRGLIYDIPALGEKYHVAMPLYEKVAEQLKREFKETAG